MSDILISYDETNYLNEVARLESIASTTLQPFINAYLALGVGTLLPTEFATLFQNPVDFIFNKMTGGVLVISGIPIIKSKALEIIAKPVGYDNFLVLYNTTVNVLGQYKIMNLYTPITPGNIATFYILTIGGQVQFNIAIEGTLQNSFKKYLTSDRAKVLYTFAQAILDSYNTLQINKFTPNEMSGESVGKFINELLITKSPLAIDLRIDGILKFN